MAPHARYLATRHFGALDGARALAIAMVLYHHSPVGAALSDGPVIAARGFLGVDLFFVLSGYLITTLLLRERDRTGAISLGGFYWRRALRILPLYLVVVTAVGGYYVLVKGEAEAARLWPFYYLFLANFLTADIPNLAPMWSLSVEEQYYLLWPLLLILLPARWLLPVLAAGIAVNVAGVIGVFGLTAPEWGPLRFALPVATYAPILMGSGLAIVLHGARGFAALWPVLGARWASPAALILLVALLAVLPRDVTGLPNLVLHLAMTALLAALVMREDSALAPVLRLAPVARLGAVSYGLYLLHLPVLHVVREAAEALGLGLGTVLFHLVYWGACWLVAEVSFRGFETVFLNMRHKPRESVGAAQ
ncbi:Peptidoglycan/LPS O-acetylase OafA/YrhL, contains acyltransferase and SGNH-hydrolase domains [Roseivivax lentus]|uniref:Peptidoglycan/LPS O-acetylase OafA/YrhL, contains acyltransferase and SGNH-hydrolase domains n=1 Tax=Roseivivax lentus TaxID=633194 RepID=A0A1N7Q575_9RHOB|nr:acyltransferase [Roseivivax lentus]SIT18004.1 Peptidoglycan/LPS O-acetylase OafA/YrhL, contains acyltransferase and SGNH-hydrolase domains [Roseivivax lentus]